MLWHNWSGLDAVRQFWLAFWLSISSVRQWAILDKCNWRNIPRLCGRYWEIRRVEDRGLWWNPNGKHLRQSVIFFWTYAALRQKKLRKGQGHQKQNQKNKPPPTNKQKHQQRSKTNHGEKLKQAQALTAVYTSPALTSSSAGNSQGPAHGLATMC